MFLIKSKIVLKQTTLELCWNVLARVSFETTAGLSFSCHFLLLNDWEALLTLRKTLPAPEKKNIKKEKERRLLLVLSWKRKRIIIPALFPGAPFECGYFWFCRWLYIPSREVSERLLKREHHRYWTELQKLTCAKWRGSELLAWGLMLMELQTRSGLYKPQKREAGPGASYHAVVASWNETAVFL